MEVQKLYLKQNVQLDPLFNQWYAWPHLIAPATAAMNVANSHVRIMKSYVQAPQIHAAAVKNPAMRGGPFLDFDTKRSHEIKALLDKTVTEQAHLIAFADAIKSLNNTLLTEARGHSLESLYAKVPEQLKGYVELVYNLNHSPVMRFVERLLYNSPYYNVGAQSIVLSLVQQDERPFVFSTPRVADDERLHHRIPFHHTGLDDLFRMRETPEAPEYIQERLGFSDDQARLFSQLLTEEKPAPPPRYTDDAVRIRYFGHACLLIERQGVSLLTDPIISYEYPHPVKRFTFNDLPEQIDYVLLTHAHSDHVVFESLLQLRHKIKTVVVPRCRGGTLEDPSLKLLLEHTGFKHVVEIDELESFDIPGGTLTGVPFWGEHGDLNISSKIAYLIKLGGKAIMCVADSSNLEPSLYTHVQQQLGDVDVLFLGMECDGAPLSWMYGALLLKPLERAMDHSRRLCGSDCVRGRDLVERFKTKRLFVYAMGQESWLSFITSIKYTEESKPIVESNKLVQACQAQGIEAERLFGSKEIFV